MNTFNYFTKNRRTYIIANVIECDACQLSLKGKRNAPVYLTIAFHINSEYVTGWRISHQRPGHRSTLRALDSSLRSAKLGEQSKPCYVISEVAGGQAVRQALHHTDSEVQISEPWDPSVVAHAERFFRVLHHTFIERLHLKFGDAAPPPIGLKKLRKLFKSWLSDYHQTPAMHLSRAQAFTYMYSREIPRSQAVDHEPSVAGQPSAAHHPHAPKGQISEPDIFPFRRSTRRVRTGQVPNSEALYLGHPFPAVQLAPPPPKI